MFTPETLDMQPVSGYGVEMAGASEQGDGVARAPEETAVDRAQRARTGN
jgi:hypothetical protein